jgi:hypothetical protein
VVGATIDQDVLEAPEPSALMRPFAFLEEEVYGVVEKGVRL